MKTRSDQQGLFTLPEDPRRTPSITLIERHYSKFKLNRRTVRWFVSVAELLKASPYELGALCGMSISEVEFMINRGVATIIPTPVAIHAALIESWYRDVVLFDRESKPVVPIHIVAAAQHLEEPNDQSSNS